MKKKNNITFIILSSKGYMGRWLQKKPIALKIKNNTSSIVIVRPKITEYGIFKLNKMAINALEENRFSMGTAQSLARDESIFDEHGPL